MATGLLNTSQPIVFNDGTMQYQFRDFLQRVDVAIDGAVLTSSWGSIGGSIAAQGDLQSALSGKADIGHTHPYSPMPSTDIAAAAHTLAAGDINRVNRFTANNAALTLPANLPVPPNSLLVLRQSGTGAMTLNTSAVTLNGTLQAWAQHVEQVLRYVGANVWEVAK